MTGQVEINWGVVVTIGIFILSHIVASVWWASKISTILAIVRSDVNSMQTSVAAFKENCFTKADAQKELAGASREHTALWKRQDEVRDKVDALAIQLARLGGT